MNRPTLHGLALAPLTVVLSMTLGGCPDEGKRPLGASCDSDSDCVSGLCSGSQCLDPDEDEDLDGITNGVEAELGSNPLDPDTDADAIRDGDEVDVVVNVDTDGDALADIVESAVLDADDDCIPDQYDVRNDVKDADLSPMVAVVCNDTGICAGKTNVMQVECSTGTARCVYTGVEGWVDPEAECDGIDENCDGVADDAFPDRDDDGSADCVDVDWDNDTTADEADNCPATANPDQADGDDDGVGNACVADYELAFGALPQGITAGVPFSITVRLAGGDDGAPLPVFEGDVTVSLLQGGSGRTLEGTLTRPAVDGAVTFDSLVIPEAGAGFSLVAASNDLGEGSTPQFTVLSGVATRFLFTMAAEQPAGEAFGFELAATDDQGNDVPAFAGRVTFTSSDPTAILPDPYTFDAGDAGRHDFSGIILRSAGDQTITATSADITGTGEVTIVGGAFEELLIEIDDTIVAGEEIDFVVIAADADGNPVADYDETLDIEVSDPAADAPASLNSSSPGRYTGSVTFYGAGPQTFAVADGLGNSADVEVTVAPAAADSFALVIPETIGTNVDFDVEVYAIDAHGNIATGFTGSVTLDSSDADATLPGPHTFAAGDAGVYTFGGVALQTSGAQTVSASAAGGITGEADITVVSGDATSLVIVTSPATVTAGTPFSMTIEFRDVGGNLASAVSRDITVEAEGGVLATTTASTASVTIPNLVLTEVSAGTTVTISAPTFALEDTAQIAVTAGAANKLSLTGPAGAIAGTAFDVTVQVLDAYDNVAAGYRGTIVFNSDDPATNPAAVVPGAYTFTAGDAGAHTFTNGVTLRTGGPTPVRITVTDQTPLPFPTATLDVAVGGGVPNRITLTGPATANAGTAFDVTVSAVDSNGNIATDYTGTVLLTATVVAGKPPATLPASYTFTATDAGRHTFTGGVTLFAAGAMVVTATDQTPLPNPVGTLNVAVAPGAVATLTLTRTGAGNVPAGTAFPVTVTAADAHGNAATNYTGRVTFTSNDTHTAPAPVLPAPYTFVAADAGVHLFTGVTLYTAGSRTVTATDAANVTGNLSVTIAPGAASKLTYGQQPVNGVAGVVQTPAVTVHIADQYDNPSPSTATVNLALPTNPGRALVTGLQVNAVAGVATFAAFSIDRPGQGYTLRASSGAFTPVTSNAFDIAWQAPTVGAATVATAGNCTEVSYSLAQNLAQPVNVRVEYDVQGDTPDAGWRLATQAGADTAVAADPVGVNQLPSSAVAATEKFLWNDLADLAAFEARSVQVRVSASLGGGVNTVGAASAAVALDRSWSAAWTPSLNTSLIATAGVGDVDADGHADLVWAAANSNNINIQYGTGGGAYGPVNTFLVDTGSMSFTKVIVADTHTRFGGDMGLADIILVDGTDDRVIVARMMLSQIDNEPYLDDWDVISPICGGGSPWVKDVEVMAQANANGPKTLAFACQNARKIVFYDWSSQQWQDRGGAADFTTVGQPTALATGDFDWNGAQDLAIGFANGNIAMYGAAITGNPLHQIVAVTGMKAVVDIEVGDLDRDGYQEVIAVDDEAVLRRLFVVFGNPASDANGNPTRLVDAASVKTVPVALLPTAVEVGDLDRDGWLDLGIANGASDQVTMMRSRAWRTPTTIEKSVFVGTGPNSLHIGDANHDGWLDLTLTRNAATSNTRIGSVVTTPRADCDPTWTGPGSAPTFGYDLSSSIVADVDGDGRNDLVHTLATGDVTGGLAVAYGRGNGRFAQDEALIMTALTPTVYAAVGDLDEDGDNDVALVEAGRIRVYEQTSRYVWVENVAVANLPIATGPVLIADVDLDRREDLVWINVNPQNGDSTLHVYLQDAAGAFVAPPTPGTGTIPIGDFALGLSLADLNTDGTLDFAFTTRRTAAATISLCTLQSTAASVWSATLADTNCAALRESNNDLVVTGFEGFVNIDADAALEVVIEVTGANQINTVQVRNASAAGLYDTVEDDAVAGSVPAGHQLCGGGVSPAFGHYGAAGNNGLDIAIRCSDSPTIAIHDRLAARWDANARNTFGEYHPVGSLATGDFNGDHLDDIVNGATVFAQGQPTAGTLFGTATALSDGVTVFDVDGNGFLDFAAMSNNGSNTFYLTRQNAAGAFLAPLADTFVQNPFGGLVAGDFDADGRDDLGSLYSNSAPATGFVYYRRDTPTGITFYENTMVAADNYFGAPVAGDFDSDGFTDFAAGYIDGNQGVHIRWFDQYAPATFEIIDSNFAANGINGLAAGRMRTADAYSAVTSGVALSGICGLSAAARVCVVVVDRNTCDGTCDVRQIDPKNPAAITAIAVGDLNQDGRDDIAIAQDGASYFLTVFLQGPAGAFSEVVSAVPTFGAYVIGLKIADLDRDGWGDIVALEERYQDDNGMHAVEIVPNAGAFPFALSPNRRLESFGWRADTWFVGDLAKTGRPALAGTVTDGDQVRIKR